MSNLLNNTSSLQEILETINNLPSASTGEQTIPVQTYCNIIAQREGTSGAYGTVAEYAGFNTSDWYPYALKFQTPQFTGNSKSIEFSIHITRGRRNGSYSDKVAFRWALCSSDANFSMYDDTKNDVTEQYQLEKGTIEFTGLTSSGTDNILTIPTTKLTPNATFYLILWGDGSHGYTQDYVTIEPPSNHIVSLTYEIAASGGSGTELPELSNPGSAADLLSGKELIDAAGNVVTGSIADFDGSYECSGDSTGGGSGSGGATLESGVFTVLDNGMFEPGTNKYILTTTNLNLSSRRMVVIFYAQTSGSYTYRSTSLLLYRATLDESFEAWKGSNDGNVSLATTGIVLDENSITLLGIIQSTAAISIQFIAI